MDKYEFNIKVEQIRKMVKREDYEMAMKIADTIDWKKVKNANLLSMVSQVYEKNEEYQDAKDILLLAFERAPIGKRLLYKLTELALKEDNLEEAQAYYREFCELARDDPRQHLLRYMILKAMEAPTEQQIHSLESYTEEELDEKWLYELAELYHEAGEEEKCVAACDKIMLMFGLGQYVDKAMELKLQHAALTKYQMDLVENREKYEEKLRAVEQSFEGEDYNDNELPDEDEFATSADDAEVKTEPVPERTEDLEKTRIFKAVRRSQPEEPAEATISALEPQMEPQTESRVEPGPEPQPEASVVEEADEGLPTPIKLVNHLMIESRTPERGMVAAKETLKQIRMETGIKNQVAKITGSKLNQRGMQTIAEKLEGKDLIIEEAGDLTAETVKDLEKFIAQDTDAMRILLLDNPRQIEMLCADNPSLVSLFDRIDGEALHMGSESEPKASAEPDNRPVRRVEPLRDSAMQIPEPEPDMISGQTVDEEEMDIDDFAQYACEYAAGIDCSITGKSMLALYERIEIMEEDGLRLTKPNAEALIEEAADRAEKPSLGRAIKGIFSSKYNKDGLLILKEEHFI